MPRYRIVGQKTYLNNQMNEVGAEVDYDGWPGSTLEPVDEVAKAVKAQFDGTRGRKAAAVQRKPDLAQFDAKAKADAAEKTKAQARSNRDQDAAGRSAREDAAKE